MRLKTALFIVIFFFSLQIGQSLFRLNTWPLSSYSMFSQKVLWENKAIVIRYHRKDGSESFWRPWIHLPIDYYKILLIFRKTFFLNDPVLAPKKKELSHFLLDYLRQHERDGEQIDSLEYLSVDLGNPDNLKGLSKGMFSYTPLYSFKESEP